MSRLPPLLPSARRLLLLGVLLTSGAGASQDRSSESEDQGSDAQPLELDAIEVSSLRLIRQLDATPTATSVVDAEDLRQGRPGLALDEALNRVPGLLLQNRYNFAQGQRLSIRGFGARAPFGVRGVRVTLDGIPQTTPDGQSQLDAVDMLSVERVEVVRGLSSSLYGNASGGLIQIESQRGDGSNSAELLATAGSYGFQRGGVKANVASGPWTMHASAWHLDYQGYSEQARTYSRLLRARADRSGSDGSLLSVVFNHIDAPRRSDMGGLTQAEVTANRRGANPLAVRLDANQSVQQNQLAVIWNTPILHQGELKLRGFHSQRDFQGQLPFPGASDVRFDRLFSGIGAQISNSATFAGRELRYILGSDAETQTDDRSRFLRFANGNSGPQTLQQLEKAGFIALFAQADLQLSDKLVATAGLRADRLRFSIDDRFDASSDLSGRRDFDELSGNLALSFEFTPTHRVYTNWGSAFESPSFTEFANPSGEGGFNPGLQPQQARAFEVGLRGSLESGLTYEVNVFNTTVRDELVPFQLDDPGDARTYYRNAGRTQRQGLELALTAPIGEHLQFKAAWTASKFRYRDYLDADGIRYDGNRLPGIPDHNLFAELAWRDSRGRYAVLDTLYIGSLYANDANTVRLPAYTVWNARAGTRLGGASGRSELYVSINNLLNQRYNGNIRVNAANARYFEPAPDRTLYMGLVLSWC